jgi:hypothetical protein
VYPAIFTQLARTELTEAQDWYEREAAGLGRRFREAISALVDRMSNNPRQFPIVYKNVRRALLRRFPFRYFSCWTARSCLLSRVSTPAGSFTLATQDINGIPHTLSFGTKQKPMHLTFSYCSGD